MFNDETLDEREACCSDADPIFSLIAEAIRWGEMAADAKTKADRVLCALPAEVQTGEAKIVIGHCQISDAPRKEIFARSEADIIRDVIAEFHTEHARIEALYDASGHDALADDAAALDEEASKAYARVNDCLPTTIQGIIALIQFWDGLEIDGAHIIAALHAIAASE